MSVNAKIGAHIHIAGDSITAPPISWYAAVGGFQDQMNFARAMASPGVGAAPTTPGPTKAVLQPGATRSIVLSAAPLLNFTAHGVPGYDIEDMTAHYDDFITAFLPFDILILENGVNELVQNVDPAQFAIDLGAFLDRVHGDAPNAQIVCLGIYTYGSPFNTGENWLTGPTRFSSGLSQTYPIEATIISCAAARPSFCQYVNQCDWTLAWESTFNLPSPGLGDGLLTTDGIHPTTNGKILMGQHLVPHFTFN